METRRPLRWATLAAALVLTLSACMKADMNLELQPDDTVDGSVTIGVSRALLEMSGQDPATLVDQMESELFEGDVELSRTEPYDDGEFVGSTMHFEAAPLATFASDGEGGLSIIREGDEFVVSGTMQAADDEVAQLGAMASGMDVRIAISFPGPVSDHNGTLVGQTVEWRPTPGESFQLTARGSAVAGGGGLPVLLIALVGVGVLVVAGIVTLLVLRRRQAAEIPAGGTTTLASSGAVFHPAGPADGAFQPGAPVAPPTAPPPTAPPAAAPPAAAPYAWAADQPPQGGQHPPQHPSV